MTCVPLVDVCHVFMGQAPDGASYNEQGNGCPLIAGAGDFGDRTPNPKKFTTHPTRISEPGDIILCIRATIGDINWSDKAYCLGRGVAGLRPKNEKLDRFYLWHLININKEKLASLGTGSTFKQISRHDIETFEIPLPLLDEQRRIAAILDKADAIQLRRKEATTFIDELLRSTFLEIFGDPVSNPKGWETNNLGNICKKITDGTHDTPKRLSFGTTFITGKHIRPFFIDFENCDYVSIEDHNEIIKRCKPERGDVLYTNIGANVGTAAVNHWDDTFSMKNVALLKPNKKVILSRYLEFVLNHAGMKTKILGANSAGGAQQFLSLTQINQIIIPVPTYSSQEKFEKIMTKASKLTDQNNHLSMEIIRLFNSLTQQAFRGELL